MGKKQLAMHEAAAKYAEKWHRGAYREDGYTPFVIHPLRGMRYLRDVCGVEEEVMLSAFVLHDVVEDTSCTNDMIRERFGGRVADLVAELTHDESVEKGDYIESFREKSREAGLLKIVDRLDNLRDMRGWKPHRKKRYAVEGVRLAAACCDNKKHLDEKYKDAWLIAIVDLLETCRDVIKESEA